MNIDIKNVKMLMWEKKDMPERNYNKEKKEWEDTGKNIEKTLYTFRDEFGSTLTLYADNSYRDLEGKQVTIGAEIDQREFQGKKTTRIKILEVQPVEPTE